MREKIRAENLARIRASWYRRDPRDFPPGVNLAMAGVLGLAAVLALVVIAVQIVRWTCP